MFLLKKNKLQNLLVFLFFFILILIVFRDLFSSYFEADEWFHFTNYLPLTKKPDGFFTSVIYNYLNTQARSGGQHATPIASSIFFLNAKLFGLYYPAYAFLSLLFHSINSFLVFLYIKIVLPGKRQMRENIFALIAGVFFALSPNALHV